MQRISATSELFYVAAICNDVSKLLSYNIVDAPNSQSIVATSSLF